jgi:hypothetical protein
MYKTLGFKWLREAFCPASAFVTADSDEARNPQRFIHVSVTANFLPLGSPNPRGIWTGSEIVRNWQFIESSTS